MTGVTELPQEVIAYLSRPHYAINHEELRRQLLAKYSASPKPPRELYVGDLVTLRGGSYFLTSVGWIRENGLDAYPETVPELNTDATLIARNNTPYFNGAA